MDAATGETRDPVMRGGSWRSGAFHCTAVAHDPGDPRMKGDNIGFRVLLKVGNE
jgi:formylglycine-generating enzyme required for sulfatase activity